MKKFDYYTAPSQEVFDDIKENALKIWKTYDDTYGDQSKKINRIKDIQNIKDNVWFIVAMFDEVNKIKLLNLVQHKTKEILAEAMGNREIE